MSYVNLNFPKLTIDQSGKHKNTLRISSPMMTRPCTLPPLRNVHVHFLTNSRQYGREIPKHYACLLRNQSEINCECSLWNSKHTYSFMNVIRFALWITVRHTVLRISHHAGYNFRNARIAVQLTETSATGSARLAQYIPKRHADAKGRWGSRNLGGCKISASPNIHRSIKQMRRSANKNS